MKVCVPTQEDKGIHSIPYGHFGSAPYFIIHDTETGTTRTVANEHQHHAHGTCHPLTAIGREAVEAVLIRGIGQRAIQGLHATGIKVYQSVEGTVQSNVDALKEGQLAELTTQNACGHHRVGGGCSD